MLLEIPTQLNIAEEFVSRPVREHPECTAILGEPSRISYAEVEAAVNRAANVLRESGCAAGERVLIILPDSIEFIGAFFGAAKIGAIAVPVNSMARAADYSYYVKDTGAQIAIVHVSAMEEFSRIETAPELRVLAISGDGAEDAVKAAGPVFAGMRKLVWNDAWNQASSRCEAHPTAATDPAFLLYTSGSGGTPKAAIHRHADMVRTSRGYAREVLGLRADDITYSVSKLFFAYGLGNGMYFPFSVGAGTVLDPGKPKVERTAELLAKYRPTILFSVPTF